MEPYARHEWPQVGVPRLDAQHRQLVVLVNRLDFAVKANDGVRELWNLAAELTLQTRLHFLDEEMIMEGAQYPALAEHRFRHAEFTEGLLRLQKQLKFNRSDHFRQIVRYELEWITKHLEDSDEAFGAWLKKTGGIAAVIGNDGEVPFWQATSSTP